MSICNDKCKPSVAVSIKMVTCEWPAMGSLNVIELKNVAIKKQHPFHINSKYEQ